MTRDTVANTDEKYFFDQNIFDEDGNIEGEIIEEEEPPVPVFSEAELAAARRKAFEDGKAEATQAEKSSRAQHLANVLEQLSADFSSLFTQETAREKLYEREAVSLVQSVFEKLFPYYAEKTGFEELAEALKEVIETRSGQQKVLVCVAPDVVEGVNAFLDKLRAHNPAVSFDVESDETLSGTACRLSWDHGGALHDTNAMAEEVLGILNDGLAAKGANSHYERDIQPSEEGAEHTDAEPTSGDDAPTPQDPVLEEKPDE